MRHTTVLVTTALFLTAILTSGCSLISTTENDQPWSNYSAWTKIHNRPVTGDHTGFLGGLHEAAQGYRLIYVNETGLATSQGQEPYQYPIGTIILKEQYKTMSALENGAKPGVTIMVKVSDNAANPADNWLWSRGLSKPAKADAFCSGCHTIAQAQDFVFSNAQTLHDFQ